jgi:hypothetical protein
MTGRLQWTRELGGCHKYLLWLQISTHVKDNKLQEIIRSQLHKDDAIVIIGLVHVVSELKGKHEN